MLLQKLANLTAFLTFVVCAQDTDYFGFERGQAQKAVRVSWEIEYDMDMRRETEELLNKTMRFYEQYPGFKQVCLLNTLGYHTEVTTIHHEMLFKTQTDFLRFADYVYDNRELMRELDDMRQFWRESGQIDNGRDMDSFIVEKIWPRASLYSDYSMVMHGPQVHGWLNEYSSVSASEGLIIINEGYSTEFSIGDGRPYGHFYEVEFYLESVVRYLDRMGMFANGDILNYKIWLGEYHHVINMVFSSPEAYARYNETMYDYPQISQVYQHRALPTDFRSVIGLKRDVERLIDITDLERFNFTDKYYGLPRTQPYGQMGSYGIVGKKHSRTTMRGLYLVVPAMDIYAAYMNYHTWEPRYQNDTYTEEGWIYTMVSQVVTGGLASLATVSSYLFGVKPLVVYSIFHVMFEGANLGLTYWAEDQVPNTYNDATKLSFTAGSVGIFFSFMLQLAYLIGLPDL